MPPTNHEINKLVVGCFYHKAGSLLQEYICFKDNYQSNALILPLFPAEQRGGEKACVPGACLLLVRVCGHLDACPWHVPQLQLSVAIAVLLAPPHQLHKAQREAGRHTYRGRR